MRTAGIIKLICWIVIALLLVAVLVWGLGFGSLDNLFSNVFHGIRYDSGVISQPSGPVSDTGDYSVPTAGIKNITVSWISGSVTVAPYDGTEIRFSESADQAITEELALKYTVSGDRLNISYFADSSVTFGRNITKKLELFIPTQLASAMEEMDLGAISAVIDISGISAEEIEITTTSGSMKVSDCTASDISLTTTSGKMTASDCICSDLSTDGISASLDYRGSATSVEINTVSGSVDLEFSIAPDEMNVDTISGSVTVHIPENDGFRIRVDKVSGNVNCEFPTVSENNYRIYGDGSAVYTVDTVSGSVNIRKIN